MASLSLEDVYGSTGPAASSPSATPSTKAPPPSFQTLSLEDVYGATSQEPKQQGIARSFWETITEKSPGELLATESIPAHLAQGMARSDYIQEQVKEQIGTLSDQRAAEGKPKLSREDWLHERHLIETAANEKLDNALGIQKEETPGLAQIYQAAKKDPGGFAGEMFKGIETDPELLFGGEMGLAAKAVRAVNASATIAKAGKVASSLARVGARAAGTAAEGGAMVGTISAAEQYSRGDVSASKTAKDAMNGGIFMSLLGLKRLGKDIEFGQGAKLSDEAMGRILGENPAAKPADVEKVYGEFKSKIPVPGEWDTAYELLNGNLKGKAKLAAQKDPKVWAAVDAIQKERQARTAAFEGDGPKTLDERLDAHKEKADGIKAIQEDQAWDEHNAFEKEPASKEEAFTKMEDFQRQRSMDDKLREALLSDKPDITPSQAGGSQAMRIPRSQRGGGFEAGKADPKLLTALGLTLGGALAGAYFGGDEKLEGAIAGGVMGIGATQLPRMVNAMKTTWRSALTGTAVVGGGTALGMWLDKDHPVEGALLGAILFGSSRVLPKARGLSSDELISVRDGTVRARDRQARNFNLAMKQAIPDQARREAFARDLNTPTATVDEARAVKSYRAMTDDYATMAKDVDLKMGFIHDYVSRIVEKQFLPAGKVQEVMGMLFGDSKTGSGPGSSTTSRFSKERKHETWDDLEKAIAGTGLRIKTMDLAEIAEEYMLSMHRAIENKRLVENLKIARENNASGSQGALLLMDAAQAPLIYKEGFSHPQLRGLAVHPDIEPSLRFIFDNANPDAVTRGALAMTYATKRLNVMGSMFHANSLVDAGIEASFTGRAFRGMNAALKQYHEGGAGDWVDQALKDGVMVSIPKDINVNIMREIGAFADQITEQATGIKSKVGEKTLGGIEQVQKRVFDHATWEYLHPGLKLSTYFSEMERAVIKHPKEDPRVLGRAVASFVNDTYGGLDWFRVAMESKTQIGRDIALARLSPARRPLLNLLMFAPDWTFSTMRSAWKAIPGNAAHPLTARLHQKYVARSALIYFTALNALNYKMSGHQIWQNNDPTRLDRGDGTTQQATKHSAEPYEWLLRPRQMALNKLGFLPKLALEIVFNKQYLSAYGSPPIEGSKLAHAVHSALPITAQQGFAGGYIDSDAAPGRAVAGFMGRPIYGKTKADKEREKAKKRLERKPDRKRD